MRLSQLLAALITATLTCSIAACGGGGINLARPAQQFFFVRGATGTLFSVGALIANNAVHRMLPNSCPPNTDSPTPNTFQTPYTFVMLNADPAVSGAFRNEDPVQDITVTMVSALDIVNVVVIPPGFCCVVAPGSTCVESSVACDNPDPPASGLETRFDVLAQVLPPPTPPNTPSIPNPANIFFTTAIGDLVNGTDTTNCVFNGSTSFCQTPTTFFLEGAEQEVSGVFNRADNAPINLDATLCINGGLQGSKIGRPQVILSVNL